MKALPKQWLHWAKSMRLTPTTLRGRYRGFYLRGRGRYWRVNSNHDFQISDRYENFDRWANSTAFTAEKFPKTKKEFEAAVRELLRLSN